MTGRYQGWTNSATWHANMMLTQSKKYLDEMLNIKPPVTPKKMSRLWDRIQRKDFGARPDSWVTGEINWDEIIHDRGLRTTGPFRTHEEMEARKEAICSKYHEEMEELYRQEIVKVFAWFKEHYPKRTLEWVDGMGVSFWVVDGDILHWETLEQKYGEGCWTSWYEAAKPDRKARKLMPLWNFFQSIHECTNQLGSYQCCIGDYDMRKALG